MGSLVGRGMASVFGNGPLLRLKLSERLVGELEVSTQLGSVVGHPPKDNSQLPNRPDLEQA